MPGLRDIGPLRVPLDIGGVVVQFAGLSAGDIFELSERFEAARALVEGGSAGLVEALRDKPALLRQCPEAICAALAISSGERGDKAAETAAACQPLSVQLGMIEAMLKATFREGVGPFVATIERLTSTASPPSEEATAAIATMTTKSQSRKRSRQPSLAALQVDLGPERLGRLRLAS